MNHRILFSDLRYRGLVKSVRREYHVLEGSQHYVLVSPGQQSGGNYTIVLKRALDYLMRRLGGRRSVTSATAFAACRRSKYFQNRFAVLNALYALVGIGAAQISKMVGPTLFFDIRKHAG
ncbi:MAG: hypothetical protein DMF89_14505 [Acidobacteria bacterium]|nr:MAG: hypothetical protein DMF89_14505 [Acidobacteriota bacterium]